MYLCVSENVRWFWMWKQLKKGRNTQICVSVVIITKFGEYFYLKYFQIWLLKPDGIPGKLQVFTELSIPCKPLQSNLKWKNISVNLLRFFFIFMGMNISLKVVSRIWDYLYFYTFYKFMLNLLPVKCRLLHNYSQITLFITFSSKLTP